MKNLFWAKSVAIIGVSESDNNLGKNILANLVKFGFQGNIYAVGPQGGEVSGYQILHGVTDLPEKIDLALILTPARFVPDILIQCGKKGIQWAVIMSGGFRELGSEGERLEEELLKASQQYGIRFVGPNCVGVVNTSNGIYTHFAELSKSFKNGRVGLCTQSGGIGIALAERLCASGMGISKLVSMGNKLCLDESNYLSYFKDDPDTAVIYFYLEGFKKGRAFAQLARHCSKPIILHKSNTSSLSRTIAQSHTAALADDDDVVNAVCNETGIVRVRSLSEAINAIKGLSLPILKGKNLAVIARSGGYAVVMADACARYDLNLPNFGQSILNEAQSGSRAGVIRLANPLDFGDIYDFSLYLRIVKKALLQEDINGIVFMQSSHIDTEQEKNRHLLSKVSELSKKYEKPIAMVLDVPFEEQKFLEKTATFPFFLDPTEAIHALSIQYQWNKFDRCRRQVNIQQNKILEPAKKIEEWMKIMEKKKRQPLLHEVFDLLDRAGLPTIPWRMARSFDETIKAAETIGYPVALKVVSSSLMHKSDKGGIALNVQNTELLKTEYLRLQNVTGDIEGILVQKMAEPSREVIIGAKKDPSFGAIVMVGMGGTMVEVIKDVSMHLAPIDMRAALEMFQGLSGSRLLGPFRGMHAADIESAADILVKISLLIHRFPQISELDLNPVGLNDEGKGALILDGRIIFSS